MRKVIFSIGAIVLVATAGFVWSRTALVSSQASTTPPISIGAAPAEAAVSISPMDMMMNYTGPLPAEQWDAF